MPNMTIKPLNCEPRTSGSGTASINENDEQRIVLTRYQTIPMILSNRPGRTSALLRHMSTAHKSISVIRTDQVIPGSSLRQ